MRRRCCARGSRPRQSDRRRHQADPHVARRRVHRAARAGLPHDAHESRWYILDLLRVGIRADAQPPTSSATSTAPVALTLDEAIARGLADEPSARRSACAHGDAAQAVAGATGGSAAASRGAGRLHPHQPRRSRSASRCRNRRCKSSIPTCPTTIRTRLDLQWPIYTGGPRRTRSSARRAPSAAAAAEDLDGARADLRLEITRAFWALVTARETERVVDESLEPHGRTAVATSRIGSTRA